MKYQTLEARNETEYGNSSYCQPNLRHLQYKLRIESYQKQEILNSSLNTLSRLHTGSYLTGSFPGISDRSMKLATQLHLAHRLKNEWS